MTTQSTVETVEMDDLLVLRAINVIDRNARDDAEFMIFVSMLTGWDIGEIERPEQRTA